MKKILLTLSGGALAVVLTVLSTSANAWWGGRDYYGPWGGGPWYGGYPYYGGWGHPYGRGGYPYGGYPYYGGWGGYPYHGAWGYPYRGYGWGAYPYAVTPVQPQAETAAAK